MNSNDIWSCTNLYIRKRREYQNSQDTKEEKEHQKNTSLPKINEKKIAKPRRDLNSLWQKPSYLNPISINSNLDHQKLPNAPKKTRSTMIKQLSRKLSENPSENAFVKTIKLEFTSSKLLKYLNEKYKN